MTEYDFVCKQARKFANTTTQQRFVSPENHHDRCKSKMQKQHFVNILKLKSQHIVHDRCREKVNNPQKTLCKYVKIEKSTQCFVCRNHAVLSIDFSQLTHSQFTQMVHYQGHVCSALKHKVCNYFTY